MEENNRRLIDEALVLEPVKNTLRLAWEFIILNKNFTLIAMGIFVLLNLLGIIPILSLVFSVFAGIFGIVIQIHVGRTFYATKNIESYVEEIKESRIQIIWTKHARAAFGVYMGWVLLVLVLLFVLGLIGAMTGVLNEHMNEQAVFNAMIGLGLPLIILVFVFSYVQPLVHSNIVLSNTFSEGLKAVFTVFTKDVWSSAFQKGYFAYVTKVGLVLILVLFFLGVLIGLFMMIPILGILATLLMLIVMYIFMVFMSIISMMARRIVEE